MSSVNKSTFTTRHLSPELRLPAWQMNICPMFEITPASEITNTGDHNSITSYLIDNQIMFSGCTKHAQRFDSSGSGGQL
ncbi:MAG: hypothetical protein WD600_07200 [Pseudohongiella sp.]